MKDGMCWAHKKLGSPGLFYTLVHVEYELKNSKNVSLNRFVTYDYVGCVSEA